MKRLIFVVANLLIVSNITVAQLHVMLFTNAQKIDENRYNEIKGKPFLFSDWKTGVIIDKKDSVYSQLTVNYNGYEEAFEVINNSNKSEYISLDDRYYKYVKIIDEQGEYIFEKGLHPKFKNKFYQVVHKSEKVICFIDYSVGVSEKKVNGNMGASSVIKQFRADPMHYFIIDGKLQSTRISKSKVGLILGEKKKIDAFIKRGKLNVKSAFDLAKVLRYYQTNLL